MSDTQELKNKAIKGMFWSFCERFGTLFILFISNIVLARLLTPENYGLIGMLMVFITISNILIDGGFGAALIQKNNPTERDYSTIFCVNSIVAFICYLVLFLSAPLIAKFYNQPELVILLRILGLIIVIDAFSVVQNNILVKNLNFKKITIIKIIVASIASTAAIISALCGLGVWSLVIQYITNSTIRTILLWTTTSWKPVLKFSKQSFRTLFGFGSKLLIASLISEIYRNFQVLIIGKFFPAKEVGYFSQAKQLENVPTSSIIAIVNQVTYPVFSQLQDSKDKMVSGIRRCIKTLASVNFPLMIFLAVIAEPLFVLLYSEKWLPSVPYFQWLCVGFGLLLVVHNSNLSLLKALGRSDTVLKLEIVKKILGLIFIFSFMHFGVIGILWALAINSIIEFFLNGYFTGKYIGYGIIKQAEDIIPVLLVAGISGVVCFVIPKLIPMHFILELVTKTVIFFLMYISMLKLMKFESYEYIRQEIKKLLRK